MRALIAFLAARQEHLTSLRDNLATLLQTADHDKDEWVQVVSGLVRRTLTPHDPENAGGHSESARFSVATLSSTVDDVLKRADRIMAERAGYGTLGADADADVRTLRDAPYFGPLEERYLSRKQQRPKETFDNAHFSAKYSFQDEFSEDLASVGGGSNLSSSQTGGSAAPPGGLTSRAGQGGAPKIPETSVPPPPTGPNLAQARRISLAATDPAAGSDGLRRTSKPLALSRNHAGHQPGAGSLFGARKGSSVAGGVRGMRAGGGTGGGSGGSGGGSRAGLMMINADELEAIHAEKISAREKAKGKPGRKKAKIEETSGPKEARGDQADCTPPAKSSTPPLTGGRDAGQNAQSQHAKPDGDKVPSSEARTKAEAAPDAQPPVPQQGEIEAMAAMMVLGVKDDTEASFLPEALVKLLENANSLQPDGKEKLESFFQKKQPEGSSVEKVKYHEEVTTGADGESTRVTSYIRLKYETWMWERVHKKKRVKS